MQISLFLRAVVTCLCLSLTGGPRSVTGFGVERPELRCPTGSFLDSTTGQCLACTEPCPGPLVEISPCRHNADTVCGEPEPGEGRVGSVNRRSTRSCSADAFYNRQTGLCQECTKFCPRPSVMTKPCRREADAVCRRPDTKRPEKGRGKPTSSRRRDKSERRRRRKTRKRQGGKSSRPTVSARPTSTQPCPGDVDCRPKIAGTAGVVTGLQSNELPKDGTRSEPAVEPNNVPRSNEYPDSPPGNGGEQRPSNPDNYGRKNAADVEERVKSDSLHSNRAE
ncbi:tumor necrosis factor receptor superfamily member 21-like [Acanthaster planci]|uniref:Tumor necrosis factor receptor superfamily member 21-like n=1 Tax=Acanthaster planci TaxID=133434 RepID=A0A8B7XQ47_ACAPL|nr:tumor necrosis factor receptor superfamily member 21-like [Acanthaster planci]